MSMKSTLLAAAVALGLAPLPVQAQAHAPTCADLDMALAHKMDSQADLERFYGLMAYQARLIHALKPDATTAEIGNIGAGVKVICASDGPIRVSGDTDIATLIADLIGDAAGG